MNDPRGPIRHIIDIQESSGPTIITKCCGHESGHAQHFTYKIGEDIRCYRCGEAGNYETCSADGMSTSTPTKQQAILELIEAAGNTLTGTNHWDCNCDRCAAREILAQAVNMIRRTAHEDFRKQAERKHPLETIATLRAEIAATIDFVGVDFAESDNAREVAASRTPAVTQATANKRCSVECPLETRPCLCYPQANGVRSCSTGRDK